MIIEEAHHILSHHKEHSIGEETITETSLRQIREFGEAVIVIDQEPTKLSHSIKANTYTKIVFALGNGRDVKDMEQCLRLTPEEAEYLDLLQVGEAIVRLKGRVQVPLHAKTPRAPIHKGTITDQQIMQDQKINGSSGILVAKERGSARRSGNRWR